MAGDGNEDGRVTGEQITVLGGGNTAFSMAANLALGGYEVLLWEHPDFAQTIAPIRDSLTIHLDGAARTGAARLAGVTTDPAEALAWSETLVCSVPSYAHQPFLEQIGPHLKPGHLLALLPGNLGTFAFTRALRDAGIGGVIVAESDTAPYVCRKSAPDRAVIWGAVTGLGIGVEPASQTDEAMPVLRALFPGSRAYSGAVEAGLSALNPVVHPPGVLMNAGRIERSRGEFWFYEEGVTPSVVNVVEGVDRERMAVGRALGLELTPVAEGFHAAGFGPKGDFWATINGSKMLTALRAPGQVETRWLTEDVPYGLATWAVLGDQLGVETPVIDALVTLASATLGRDFRTETRRFDASELPVLAGAGQ
ncbi:MAG: NAD/NADP octopine/nopaline dehydrogenase family protein [Thermomicrobiales bacterium]|nr:NAD/NADP octopine/nopaline dehydrogenase family protein [Thermomicrobiales bacterium]